MRTVSPGILALAVFLAPVSALAQPVRAVSQTPFGQSSDTGGTDSVTDTAFAASSDGRYVVFRSTAGNLVQGEVLPPYYYSVFLRDRVSGLTSLVSHTSGSLVTGGNGSSGDGIISGDGAFAAFTSWSSDIVPGTALQNNAYLYDRGSGQVTLVSHALGVPGTDGNAGSRVRGISADGRYVVFLSFAGNLVGNGPVSPVEQAYVFDRMTGLNALVSHVPASPTTPGSGGCGNVVISADGSWIGFASFAPDLVTGSDVNGTYDVFLLERGSGTVSLVSHAFSQATTAAAGSSTTPAVSDDGGVLVFSSTATDLLSTPDPATGADVFGFDRASGTVFLVSHAAAGAQQPANAASESPVVSGDGQRVAFTSDATDIVPGVDQNSASDVFLFDIPTAAMRLVSHVPGSASSAGSGESDDPHLDGNGDLVAFVSDAQDLVAGFSGGPGRSTFVYSWSTGGVVLASHALGSGVAGEGGVEPVVSRDGSVVAFISHSGDIVPPDANYRDDVFGFSTSTGQNEIISRRAPGMPDRTGNIGSGTAGNNLPKVSSDGRYVVFQSDANNLVQGIVIPDGAFGFVRGIYLFDAANSVTRLVSHVPGDPLAPGCLVPLGPEPPSDAVISGDGATVAFTCPLLLSGSPLQQVYLYDRDTQGLLLASHAYTGPDVPGFGDSGLATVSLDGSRVAFTSTAVNLTSGSYPPIGSAFQAFLYDRGTGVVHLLSHAAGQPQQPTDGLSYGTVVSGDGSHVVFTSDADGLVNGVSNPSHYRNVYLYDVASATTVLVSHAAGSPNVPTDSQTNWASVSDDGRFVAFDSVAGNLVVGQVDAGFDSDVFVYDKSDGSNALASHLPLLPATAGGGVASSLSGDGGTVGFSCDESLVGGTPSGQMNICVFDRLTGEVKLASHAFGSPTVGGDNGGGAWSTPSGDGSTVAFFSYSTDLLDHPILPLGNVFVYERASGAVRLVSHLFGAAGEAAGLAASAARPGTSHDGRYVTFESSAAGMVPGDFNAAPDVFLFGPIGPTSADLAVTKSDGQTTATAGQSLTYNVAVTNPGPGAVSGAVLSDSVPAILQGATWYCSGSGGAACQYAGGSGDIQVAADLPVGSTLMVALGGIVDPTASPGTLTNSASVALPAGYSDPNPSNNSATDTDTLIVQADMSTTQSDAPDPVHVGQNVTYSVIAQNNGPSQAAGGTLTDTLPAGTTLVATVPGPPTCTSGGGSVTCTFGTLPPGGTTPVNVTVQTSTWGAITNVAQVSGTTPDPVPVNDVSTESGLVVNRPPGELVHGSSEVRDLDPATSPTTGPDFYRLRQEAVSSYEVLVDAATGDIGSGAGPSLDRVREDGATVIQSSVPAGAGGSRRLAWQNAQTVVEDEQYVRVASAGCAPCGPQDTYRIRAWETTLSGARFNNSASQVTVLVLENATASQVFGYVWFRAGSGPILNFDSFLIPPRGTFVLNTASLVPGVAGSLVVTHIAPYGGLGGKLVSVEPATGFTFDTPLVSRPR